MNIINDYYSSYSIILIAPLYYVFQVATKTIPRMYYLDTVRNRLSYLLSLEPLRNLLIPPVHLILHRSRSHPSLLRNQGFPSINISPPRHLCRGISLQRLVRILTFYYLNLLNSNPISTMKITKTCTHMHR